MPVRYLALSLVVVLSAGVGETSAQVAWANRPFTREAANGAGRFLGTVHDESGAALPGVAILAMGPSIAAVTTNLEGRFELDLPAGAYLIRAARAGYVSTFRELVEVHPYSAVERRIRLIRADAAPADLSTATAAAPVPAAIGEAEPGRGEVAWRLRHLTRTVLRDTSPGAVPAERQPVFGSEPVDLAALFDRTVQRSARMATSFLTNTEFTGQLNLFTMRSVGMQTTPDVVDLSRGIADVIIGAPVGTVGDWSVRGAMLAGDSSSWTLLGEYQARGDQRHPLRVAISYSTQGLAAGRELPMSMVAPEARSAGGLRVSDRWQARPSVAVDYSLRYDRYDYLSEPDLLSPSVATRVRAFDGTFITGSAGQQMIAPGADEFQPPAAAGPWLPPTRTFSSLSPSHALVPERVRRATLGVEHGFRSRHLPVVNVEWFSSSAVNQIATLYGLDRDRQVGHYYVATAGDVEVVGWRFRASGVVAENVRAAIEYAFGDAFWTSTRGAGSLRRTVPALARKGLDRVSDLRASADVTVTRTATRVALTWRLNTAAPQTAASTPQRIGTGRVNLDVAQRLPYQPLDSGMLNLLFTLRTFLHDEDAGALYDEVLTLRPPMRLTGGLQVRF